MDNNQAMQEFASHNNLQKNILSDDGTLVFLVRPKYDGVLTFESCGKGDGFGKIISYTFKKKKISN